MDTPTKLRLVGAAVLIALAVVNEAVSRKSLAEPSNMAVAAGNLATRNLRNAEAINLAQHSPHRIDLGIIHYASDTPYTRAQTLGGRGMSY